MSIEELRKRQDERIDLEDLPKKMKLILLEYYNKKDSKLRTCLYLKLQITEGEDKGKTFIQKYTPFQIKALADSLDNLGVSHLDELVNKPYHYVKHNYEMGKPRFVVSDE